MNKLIKHTKRKQCFLNYLMLLCFFGCLNVLELKAQKNELNFNKVAQQQVNKNKISGMVLSKDENLPVIGAVVLEKGVSNNAAVTNLNGEFSLQVSENSILIIKCLGYKTQEIKVGEALKYKILLEEDIKNIDDVVVIGYGVQKKNDLTGSVSVTNMNDMTKAPVASFDNALAGRIAGVSVSSIDGQPGESMDIVVRGGNSLTQSNSPLYVIDGFPVEDFNIASLSASDIKSISILKDASSTAIYGSRGANGVIIIETQDGRIGKTKVSYDGYVGFQRVTKTMDLMSPYEYLKYQYEIYPDFVTNQYLYDGKTFEDYKNVKGIDWQDLLFQDGFTQSHSVSVDGGSNATKFSISASYFDQIGTVINSGYKRYNGRIYLNHTLNSKIRFNTSMDYTNDETYGDQSRMSTGTTQVYSTYLLYRTWGYRPLAGKSAEDLLGDLIDPESADQRVNPILDMKNTINKKGGEYVRASANVYIKFNRDFELVIKGGINNRTSIEKAFYNSLTSRGSTLLGGNTKGVNGYISTWNGRTFVNEYLLNYNKKWKANKFNSTLGWTIQQDKTSTYKLAGENVTLEDLEFSGLDTGTAGANTTTESINRLLSFIARANYTYKDKYLFTTTFRADASSKFAASNRWGYFPSGAFAWRLSEEKFMEKVPTISNAKLRISYGLTGNNRIGDFSRYAQMSTNYGTYYPFGNSTGEDNRGIRVSSIGNQDLKWETTGQLDLGLDLSLFKNRINLIVDYYNKKTKDLLLNANIVNTSGYSSIYKNIGSVQNTGLEFTLSTFNINKKKFRWESEFNISFNNSKVLSLNGGQDRLLSPVSWAFANTPLYMAKVGEPIAQFVGLIWEGVYNYDDFNVVNGKYVLKSQVAANGSPRSSIQPGDIKYKDVNGDGTVTLSDMVVIGRALPIHIGGFNNNFTYDKFSLNVFFQWSYGQNVMNGNRIYLEGNITNRPGLNQFASYANRWTPENTTSTLFRANGFGPPDYYSNRTLEDASFLRLKTLSLSYELPNKLKKSITADNLSVYLSAQNLYTWTKYSGMDPEVSIRNTALTPGLDYSAYPKSITLVVGIKAVF